MLKNPQFIFWFTLLCLIQILFLPVLIFSYFYFYIIWIIKLLIYIIKSQKKELKPSNNNIKFKSVFNIYLYTQYIWKPYMLAFSIIYFLLKKFYNKKDNSLKSTLMLILNFIFNFIFKIITGISKSFFLTAFEYSIKLIDLEDFEDLKSTIYCCLLPITLKEFNFCFNLKIYKTDEQLFNFNPKIKPANYVLINKDLGVYQNFEPDVYKFLRKNFEYKELVTIKETYFDFKSLLKERYISLKSKEEIGSHYCKLFKITEKDSNYSFFFNFTSKNFLISNLNENKVYINVETQNLKNNLNQSFTNFLITSKNDVKLTTPEYKETHNLIKWLNELELADARNYIDFFFSLNKNFILLDKNGLKEFTLNAKNETLFQILKTNNNDIIKLNLNYKKLNFFDSINNIYKNNSSKISKIDLYYLNFWLIDLNTSDKIYENLIKKIEDKDIKFELIENDSFL